MRLRETATGQNTQEAWTSAWATGKEEQRCLYFKDSLHRNGKRNKNFRTENTPLPTTPREQKTNKHTLNKSNKLLRTGFVAAQARDLHLHDSRERQKK